MQLTDLIAPVPAVQSLLASVNQGQTTLVTGIDGSAKTALLATIAQVTDRPQLVVVDTLYHLQALVSDLENLVDPQRVLAFPTEEVLATEMATSSPDFRLQRLEALQGLLHATQPIVVVTAAGLRRRLVDPVTFQAAQFTWHVGDEIDLATVREQLMQMGYRLDKMVMRPGDFAIRGSILDIYALNTPHPIRIDLFDTEIDSLRYFAVESQQSLANVAEVTILPATDLIATPAQHEQLRTNLTAEVAALPDPSDEAANGALAQATLAEVAAGYLPNEALAYADWLYPANQSLLNYLPDTTTVIFDDWPRINDQLTTLAEQEEQWLRHAVQAKQRVHVPQLGTDVLTQLAELKTARIYLARFQKGHGHQKFDQLLDLHTRPMQQFFGQTELFAHELQTWQQMGETVILLAASEHRRKQITQLLPAELGVITETTPTQLLEHQTQIVATNLRHGFEFPGANLVVVTESELFQQVTPTRKRTTKLANAERIKNYNDLKPGDYVVHVNHGIGVFAGIETMVVDGAHQDYIVLNFRDHAQIFVPVTQLNLVQKYVAADSKPPHVNRLGGTEWAKTKQRVSAKIEDIADELIELYAVRSEKPGFAFPKDDYLQAQFDADFPYHPTADQVQSIDEIKHDMEASRPMDRLLVGDVGYGKTEVAMRAIFKAVQGGKQAAMLVPTTILAQQHYETLKDRFANFPVEIAVLSRFLSRQQVKETLAKLAAGQIDVIVGTHKLLSEQVEFADLGLLVVDEEQRFGVKHKERLKQLQANVDVLTLTATPIPRTLNMSMLGVRDLSVLETPPVGRYPIQTYVLEQNEVVIQDGIRRELQRHGQVFYLHNRVHDIEQVVANLNQLVPEARVAAIHGQMTENQLERVLYDFVNREYDVLVTTSIIETGVDISNVNTLFVEDADRLGLAQLYQIRGRIGRSNQVAYAYLMYQPNKVLTEQGEQRLAAIRDFTELGSGFKIAMRDLAIRGAGNLLGKQQHGFIDSVGYDLYTTMLKEAVAKKRGEVLPEQSDAEIKLGVEAYLPSEYVPDQRQKMELYKRIRQTTAAGMLDLAGDLIDRYGDYGPAVANLLLVAQIKAVADTALLSLVERKQDNLYLTWTPTGNRRLQVTAVMQAIAATKFKSTMSENEQGLVIRLIIQPWMKEDEWLKQLLTLLTTLATKMEEIDATR